MASITINNFPEEIHGQLQRESEANFRSLDQEVLARLVRTFEIDHALNSKRDQKWIDEAIASGPATALTEKDLDDVRGRVLGRKN